TPLLLRVPGASPRTVSAPVSNLDVVPTVLDLLGGRGGAPAGSGSAASPPAGAAFDGRRLLPAVLRPPLPPALPYAAQGAVRRVAAGRFKLVHDLATRRFALYDLAADPGETRDVLADHRRDSRRLRAAIGAWLARTEGGTAAASLQRAAEADRRLRSVG